MNREEFDVEVGRYFQTLKDVINMYCTSGNISTQAHEALMKLRALAVNTRDELEASKTTKELQRFHCSIPGQDLADMIQDFPQAANVKILDADASTDSHYAVSKIDAVFLIDLNPMRDIDEQPEHIIVLQKNMKVDWIPMPKTLANG